MPNPDERPATKARPRQARSAPRRSYARHANRSPASLPQLGPARGSQTTLPRGTAHAARRTNQRNRARQGSNLVPRSHEDQSHARKPRERIRRIPPGSDGTPHGRARLKAIAGSTRSTSDCSTPRQAHRSAGPLDRECERPEQPTSRSPAAPGLPFRRSPPPSPAAPRTPPRDPRPHPRRNPRSPAATVLPGAPPPASMARAMA